MTDIIMGHADYGKSDIRLVKVARDTDRHEVTDLRVQVLLEGDIERGYLDGDNTDWMSTDTIRNIVYARAKSDLTASVEDFGVALVRFFVEAAPQARRATISLTQRRWERIGGAHNHAFVLGAGLRTATVAGDGQTFGIEAGIDEQTIMKTTASGWEGYLKDPFTTLPETDERILATELTARWQYGDNPGLDFDGLWTGVRDQILETFGDHYSPGAQNDIYLMGKAVLERFPEVQRIHFSLPNNHHLLFDLQRFGIANDNEVFHVSGDPHGLLQGTVERG